MRSTPPRCFLPSRCASHQRSLDRRACPDRASLVGQSLSRRLRDGVDVGIPIRTFSAEWPEYFWRAVDESCHNCSNPFGTGAARGRSALPEAILARVCLRRHQPGVRVGDRGRSHAASPGGIRADRPGRWRAGCRAHCPIGSAGITRGRGGPDSTGDSATGTMLACFRSRCLSFIPASARVSGVSAGAWAKRPDRLRHT